MSSQLALVKKDTVDIVAQKVRQFQQSGEIHLPAGYSADNAMKSAWLMLQSTKDRNGKIVLESCTKDSIANSLLDMVVQGLNVAKKQGYFIAYGTQLAFQRSYFGTMAVAMQVDDTIQEIIAEVVYEGDLFEFEIVRGKKEITKHKQTLDSINSKKIKAAYCMVVDENGEIRKTEIMTFDEIKQAWKQSPTNPVNEKGEIKVGSTHDKFIAEMAKKTVINKACKPIINSSSDKHLLMAVNRGDGARAQDDVQTEIEEKANKEMLDVEYEVEREDDIPTEPEAEKDTPAPDVVNDFGDKEPPF